MATTTPLPHRDIYVNANGIRHHLIARGHPGTPVVMMLHGLAGQARTFDGIANHLAQKYHVYCLDVRGRGESEWGQPDGYHVNNYIEDLEAVRDALGLEQMMLVGTSMGGVISMYYIPLHPDRVSRVVLNDIGPAIEPAGLARIAEYVGHPPEYFADFKSVLRYYKEHYGPMVEHLPDDQVEAFARHNVRKNDVGVYVWKMDPEIRKFHVPPAAPDPWETFNKIACPVLVLRGANSDVLSPENAAKMAADTPNGKLVEVLGVGHAPVLTEPVAKSALDAFLAG